MYAIIEASGKQYRVTPGDILTLDSLSGKVGEKIKFDKVLLVGGKDATLVGAPYVSQAAIDAEIVEHARGEKLLTIKYRRRKGYRRMIGHRSELTKVLVTSLNNGQGGKLDFDASKRREVLMRASIKQAAPKAAAAPKKEKAAAPKAVKAKAKKA